MQRLIAMSSMTLLNVAMLLVIVFLAIAINRTGKTNKLLHEKNARERKRENARDADNLIHNH